MQETQRKSPYADQTQGHKTKAVTQTFCNTKIQKDSTNVKRFDKELIRARLPFNTLIDHYGFKVDSHDKLVCPFHIDSQASATVRNNYFYCYGCGEKADVFGFIAKLENCNFSRAVAIAAVLAGVAPSSSADVRQAIEARKRLHEQREHTRRAVTANIPCWPALRGCQGALMPITQKSLTPCLSNGSRRCLQWLTCGL